MAFIRAATRGSHHHYYRYSTALPDTQKLYEVMQDGHLAWGLPLSVVVVTICLLVVMGPTTLIGLGILLLFVPLVRYVMTTMLAIRHKRARWTDTRIKIINSMIQGVRMEELSENCSFCLWH